MKTPSVSAAIALACVLPGVSCANATPRSWALIGEADDWFVPENWTPAGTPTAEDILTIGGSSIITGGVNIATPGAVAQGVRIDGLSVLVIKPAAGGKERPSLTTGFCAVDPGGPEGQIVVSGADLNSGRIDLGFRIFGRMQVDSGGTVKGTTACFGFDGGGTGVVTGAGSTWTLTDGISDQTGLFLGRRRGTGRLTVSAGAKAEFAGNVYLAGTPWYDAFDYMSSGSIVLDGEGVTGTSLRAPSVFVGAGGGGILTVRNGAELIVESISLAYKSGAAGFLLIGAGGPAGSLKTGSILMGGGFSFLDVDITTPFVLTPPLILSKDHGSVRLRKAGPAKLTIATTVDASVAVEFVGGQIALGDGLNRGVYEGTINTPPGSTVFFNSPGSNVSSLILSGSAGVTKQGNGTFELIHQQTTSGPLTVENGTLGLICSGPPGGGAPTSGSFDSVARVSIDTVGSGEPAVLSMNGAGCTLTANQNALAIGCAVGTRAAGTLRLLNGAGLTNQVGSVGVLSTGTGTVLVDNATWTNLEELTIGRGGRGTVTVQNGGRLYSDNAIIGKSSGPAADGTLIIKDPASILDSGIYSQFIGDSGTGTLELRNGGTALTTGSCIVGYLTGSTGSVLITGPGSAWKNSSTSIGPNGTGAVTVADGGVLQQPQAVVTVARNPGGTGRLRIGAGGAPGSVNATGVQLGHGSAAKSGHGILEFNHTGTFPFSLPVTGFNGTLLESGPDTTVITGTHPFTGVITITGGCLQADGAFPNVTGVTVAAGGTLCGHGSIGIPAATLTVDPGGTLAPTPGQTLTFQGAVINHGVLRLSGGAVLSAASVVNNGTLDLITAGSSALPPGFVNNGTVLDAASVKITGITAAAGTVAVSIPARAGHTWQLQRTTSLTAGPWTDTGSPRVTASDETLTFTDPAPPPGRAWYRLKITP